MIGSSAKMRMIGCNTKKTLFVSTLQDASWGGSEELWAQTAIELRRSKLDVSVRVPRWPRTPATINELSDAGASVKFVNRSLLGRLVRRVLPQTQREWLRRSHPNLVVVAQSGGVDGLVWMESCQELGIPFVTISQQVSDTWWPSDEIADRLRRTMPNARRCFFVSDSNRRMIEFQLGQTLKQAKVVRNPFLVPYDFRPGWPKCNVPRFACVGRLEPAQKGQDLILRVLQSSRWQSRHYRMTFYGSGASQASLKNLAAFLGVQKVDFAGFCLPTEIWPKEELLILPSRVEGLPLALVEAMLSGRPALVTDVAGNAEVVRDGEDGFVAKAPTVELLSEAMERAWNKRMEWQTMGECAAASIRRLVPPDPARAFADDLLGVLSEL